MLRVVLNKPCHILSPPSLSISWTRGYATTTRKKKVEEKVEIIPERKERGKNKEGKEKEVKKEKESNIPSVSKSKKWGLFGDIHFDDRTLGRVVKTSEWILKTFKENNVTQVYYLFSLFKNIDIFYFV